MKKLIHVLLSIYVCLSISCIYLLMRRNVYLEDQNRRLNRKHPKGAAFVLPRKEYTSEEICDMFEKCQNWFDSHKKHTL